MPKKAVELNALTIGRLNKPGMFAVGGVVGLYIQIAGASKSWVLQYKLNGQRRKMGLGTRIIQSAASLFTGGTALGGYGATQRRVLLIICLECPTW